MQGGKPSLHPAARLLSLRGRQWCATPDARPFGARLRLRSAAACASAIDPHYARSAHAEAHIELPVPVA
ncbi:hypothetical protein UJ79_22010 [Salmonella enterica subsp. enterica serovar Muenchen]|nr:hypothetical protein [Salmonella enterica subsp. enterica serovar Muenchen]